MGTGSRESGHKDLYRNQIFIIKTYRITFNERPPPSNKRPPLPNIFFIQNYFINFLESLSS
jgi:hypothetical protein